MREVVPPRQKLLLILPLPAKGRLCGCLGMWGRAGGGEAGG